MDDDTTDLRTLQDMRTEDRAKFEINLDDCPADGLAILITAGDVDVVVLATRAGRNVDIETRGYHHETQVGVWGAIIRPTD